jgi:hypothetical protein
LALFSREFVAKALPALQFEGGLYKNLPADFNKQFGVVLRHWEENTCSKTPKRPKSFMDSVKAKKSKSA